MAAEMIIATPMITEPMMIAERGILIFLDLFLDRERRDQDDDQKSERKYDEADRDEDDGRFDNVQSSSSFTIMPSTGAIDKRFNIIFLHEILNKRTARPNANGCRN